MAFFESDTQLYDVFEELIQRLQTQNPKAIRSVEKSKMAFRFNCSDPQGTIVINGRQKPAVVTYGDTPVKQKIDIDATLQTDVLHGVLLDDVSLRKAINQGDIKIKGFMLKALVLSDLFFEGRKLYADILADKGLA